MKNLVLAILILLSTLVVNACSNQESMNDIIPLPEPGSLSLVGDAEMTVELGEPYVEPGFRIGDVDAIVYVEGTVNTSKLGTYRIEYFIRDENGQKQQSVFRDVTVVDTTPPIVIFVEEFTLVMGHFDPILLIEYLFDADAKNLTIRSDIDQLIASQPEGGSGIVTITVRDSSGNATSGSVLVHHEGLVHEVLSISEIYDFAVSNFEFVYCNSEANQFFGGTMEYCKSIESEGIDMVYWYEYRYEKDESYYGVRLSDDTLFMYFSAPYDEDTAYMTLIALFWEYNRLSWMSIEFRTMPISDRFTLSYVFDRLYITYFPTYENEDLIWDAWPNIVNENIKDFAQQAIYEMVFEHLPFLWNHLRVQFDLDLEFLMKVMQNYEGDPLID